MTTISRLSLAGLALVLCAPAMAQESDYLSRYEGAFKGSGVVSVKESENTAKVNCSMQGQAGENRLSMSGTCRAAVIFSRKISATLQFDPGSKRYTGTYVGSTIGPARLSGTRRGDSINLTITWPKPVRGDTKAAMTIRNSGGGQASITISDQVPAGGPSKQVSQLTLSKS